ncbi:NAD(P)H-dependent oxidoreductase [Vagococcus vulneris]|uniref:Flavodoxin-like fold domain-containing protein n=1 Tax=Vagococcus vulneris TaxID=1977869 RepID=A0A429ZX39_9ENTE|nr:NAD(P)H-dependent oxidoreductase [Vagococcus vulneris]RST98226.1 hypothetical protein CBF37_08645 [Vagococcus vulneris]
MIKTIVIVGHPSPADSGCQQFLRESAQLEQVEYYIATNQMDYQQVKRVQEHLVEFDRIIFQFPMYWYSVPGHFKMWIDTVFENSERNNLFSGKEFGLVINYGVKSSDFQAGRKERYTLSELCRPFESFANKLGMIFLPIFSISQFYYLTSSEMKRLAVDYQQYLTKKNSNDFLSKEVWIQQRLNLFAVQEKDDKRLRIFKHIVDHIASNRDQLSSLEESLTWIKEESSYE